MSFLSLGLSSKACVHTTVRGRSKCISFYAKLGATMHLCCKVSKKSQLFRGLRGHYPVSGGHLLWRWNCFSRKSGAKIHRLHCLLWFLENWMGVISNLKGPQLPSSGLQLPSPINSLSTTKTKFTHDQAEETFRTSMTSQVWHKTLHQVWPYKRKTSSQHVQLTFKNWVCWEKGILRVCRPMASNILIPID